MRRKAERKMRWKNEIGTNMKKVGIRWDKEGKEGKHGEKKKNKQERRERKNG